jgi:WD40 repeat protein
VVTANDNGTLGWWSVDRSQVSSTGAVNDIAFTDDGTHGVSVDATGGVLTNYWGGDGKFLRGPNAVYTDVSFSGSGNRVAVAGGSEMANVSDFDRVGVVLNGHWSTAAERPGTVHAITFGADDDTVFTGDTTGKVNRWDVEITDGGTTLRNPVELKAPGTGAAHQNAVCGMAIDDNRTTLVTGGFDHVARLWNAADGTPKGKPLVGHQDLVCGVAFDRTGEVVATASFDNTVRLWDARTGDPLGEPLVGHTGPVLSVAFDGRGKLASGSYDRTVRLWEVADPAAPTPWAALTGHRDKVNVVRFRPGTTELHTGGDDRTVRVWRLDFAGPDGVLADACEQVRGDLTRAGLEEHTPELDPDEHLSMCAG